MAVGMSKEEANGVVMGEGNRPTGLMEFNLLSSAANMSASAPLNPCLVMSVLKVLLSYSPYAVSLRQNCAITLGRICTVFPARMSTVLPEFFVPFVRSLAVVLSSTERDEATAGLIAVLNLNPQCLAAPGAVEAFLVFCASYIMHGFGAIVTQEPTYDEDGLADGEVASEDSDSVCFEFIDFTPGASGHVPSSLLVSQLGAILKAIQVNMGQGYWVGVNTMLFSALASNGMSDTEVAFNPDSVRLIQEKTLAHMTFFNQVYGL